MNIEKIAATAHRNMVDLLKQQMQKNAVDPSTLKNIELPYNWMVPSAIGGAVVGGLGGLAAGGVGGYTLSKGYGEHVKRRSMLRNILAGFVGGMGGAAIGTRVGALAGAGLGGTAALGALALQRQKQSSLMKEARAGNPNNVAFCKALQPGLLPGIDGPQIRFIHQGNPLIGQKLAAMFRAATDPDTLEYMHGMEKKSKK